jgi:hypothetical protein
MVADNKERFGRITKGFTELKKSTNPSYCFYGNADCSEKFIRAHSIQKSRILKKISNDNHILYFQTSLSEDDDLRFEPKRLGIDKATIFTGFCEKHDSELFKPIEERDYDVGDQTQEFLFAYRGLAKEHHTKLNAMSAQDTLCKWVKEEDLPHLRKYFFVKDDRDFEALKYNKRQLYFTLKEMKQSFKNLEERRIAMNNNLDDEDYWKIETQVIEYVKPPNLGPALNLDFFHLASNELKEICLHIQLL